MRRSLEFSVLAIIGLTALAIGAINAPPELRQRFPVPLAYAAMAGLSLAGAARMTGLQTTRGTTIAVATLILLGLVGVSATQWKRQTDAWRSARRNELTEAAAAEATRAAMARRMADSYTADENADPETRKHFDEFVRGLRGADEDIRGRWTEDAMQSRLQEETSLWRWLNSRTLPHGTWKAPWPALFTLVELLLSAALGVWIFRMVPAPGSTGTPARA